MIFFTCIFLGFIIAATGSITPSFLNLTVVKFSLQSGRKSAFYLIAGFTTVLFFQANIGAYLSSVLMENSEYIIYIQILGTIILLLLSIHYFRLHFTSKKENIKVQIDKSKSYLHGVGMASLNTIAIPFYFTTISLLISMTYFKYSMLNGFYFSIGSSIGSFTVYSIYATIASKIEHKLTYIASKMDFILGCLTGVVGTGNLIFLLYSK